MRHLTDQQALPAVPTSLGAFLMPAWTQLWAAAEEAAELDGTDPRYVFEPLGLLLQPPGQPLPLDYEATPEGSLTFASTGGDGVHFSASLGLDGPIIVMTVPMQFETPNVVVGRDLHEFLCLGSTHGYFGLEQLAYNLERTSETLSWDQERLESEERWLRHLRTRLALKSWPDVKSQLSEYQQLLPRTP